MPISSAESIVIVDSPIVEATSVTAVGKTDRRARSPPDGCDALQQVGAPVVVVPKRKTVVLQTTKIERPRPKSTNVPELNTRREKFLQPKEFGMPPTVFSLKSRETPLISRNGDETNDPEMLDELTLPLQLATPKLIRRGHRTRVLEDVASEDELA